MRRDYSMKALIGIYKKVFWSQSFKELDYPETSRGHEHVFYSWVWASKDIFKPYRVIVTIIKPNDRTEYDAIVVCDFPDVGDMVARILLKEESGEQHVTIVWEQFTANGWEEINQLPTGKGWFQLQALTYEIARYCEL